MSHQLPSSIERINNRFDNWKYPIDRSIEMIDDVTALERAGKAFSFAEWNRFVETQVAGLGVSDLTVMRAAASLGIILDEGQIDYEIMVKIKHLDDSMIDRLNRLLKPGLRAPDLLKKMVQFHKWNYEGGTDDSSFVKKIRDVYGYMSIARNQANLPDVDGFCYTNYLKMNNLFVFRECGYYPHINTFCDYSDKWQVSHIMFDRTEFDSIVHPTLVVSDKTIRSSRTFRCEDEECTGYTVDQKAVRWSQNLLPTCWFCYNDCSDFEIGGTELRSMRVGATFKPVSIDDYITTVEEQQQIKPLTTDERRQQVRNYTPHAVDRLSEALKGRERNFHDQMLDSIEEEVRMMNPSEFEVRSFTDLRTNPFNDSKQISTVTKDTDQMTTIRNEMSELKQFIRSLSVIGTNTIMPNDSASRLNSPENSKDVRELSRINNNGFIRSVENHRPGQFEEKVIQGYMLTEEEAERAEKKMSELQAVCGLPAVFTDRRLDFLWYIHVPLEKYFTDKSDGIKRYPTRNPRNCFQTMMKSRDSTPQTTLLRQVAKVSFDFEEGVVLSNAFDLPNLHPGQSITDLSLFIMLDQLKREYELKWHSVLNGGSLPDFADRFSSKSGSSDGRSLQSSQSRRRSSSSSERRSIADSIVSYTSGRGGKSFTR